VWESRSGFSVSADPRDTAPGELVDNDKEWTWQRFPNASNGRQLRRARWTADAAPRFPPTPSSGPSI
jgi:hypothetical protein